MACWRHIIAPVLWLWGDGQWMMKWMKGDQDAARQLPRLLPLAARGNYCGRGSHDASRPAAGVRQGDRILSLLKSLAKSFTEIPHRNSFCRKCLRFTPGKITIAIQSDQRPDKSRRGGIRIKYRYLTIGAVGDLMLAGLGLACVPAFAARSKKSMRTTDRRYDAMMRMDDRRPGQTRWPTSSSTTRPTARPTTSRDTFARR